MKYTQTVLYAVLKISIDFFSFMNDFEELVYEEGMEEEDESFEVINIPCDDSKDLCGGDSCPCTCHNSEDELFKTRASHCTTCGIKVKRNDMTSMNYSFILKIAVHQWKNIPRL